MQNTKTNEVFSLNEIVNANDYKKIILNIDSTYRNSQSMMSTNFFYDLSFPIKNAIKMRLSSIEIPNTWFEFSDKNYQNTFFTIIAPDINGTQKTMNIIIPDGNYTTSQLLNNIQTKFNEFRPTLGIYMLISIDPFSLKVNITFQGTIPPGTASPPVSPTNLPLGPFVLDFTTPLTSLTNWGLGYLLGYRQRYYTVTNLVNNVYTQQGESICDTVTASYIFLIINDWYSVIQKTDENYFDATAKIIVRQDKGSVIYYDGSDLVSNQITFPSPIDLNQLKVQLVDTDGNILDLNSMNFSFAMEITLVQNSKLNEHYRNYIWDGQDPKISRNTRGSAVAGFQALPGNIL
jgi:hypothetical protein